MKNEDDGLAGVVHMPFLSAYACTVLTELPGHDVERYYYPGGSTDWGRDGLLVRIVPDHRDAWIGVFAFGDYPESTGVYSCPSALHLCVVAKGEGYIVAVDSPSNYDSVEAFPVCGIYPAVQRGILVVQSLTDFVAYDSTGIAWRSQQISYDGIVIDSINDDYLTGQAWDAPEGRFVDFRLDLQNGTHVGGAGLLA